MYYLDLVGWIDRWVDISINFFTNFRYHEFKTFFIEKYFLQLFSTSLNFVFESIFVSRMSKYFLGKNLKIFNEMLILGKWQSVIWSRVLSKRITKNLFLHISTLNVLLSSEHFGSSQKVRPFVEGNI